MKKLVFKYKKWYSRLFLFFNLLVPFLMFILAESCAASNAAILKSISESTGKIVGAVGVGILTILGLLYVQRTFSGVSRLKYYLYSKDKHYKYLKIGLIFYAVTLVICITTVTGQHFSNFKDTQWMKWLLYAGVGILFITCVTCNIFIQMFEIQNYFQIYYYRHKDTDVKEVLEAMEANAKLRKVR